MQQSWVKPQPRPCLSEGINPKNEASHHAYNAKARELRGKIDRIRCKEKNKTIMEVTFSRLVTHQPKGKMPYTELVKFTRNIPDKPKTKLDRQKIQIQSMEIAIKYFRRKSTKNGFTETEEHAISREARLKHNYYQLKKKINL